nr:hypothetical protein [Candidatus Brachybacter algidus]
MDRALRANVITKSGKAVETAGDIDVLLLDKTGTITIGNRKATHFYPANGIDSTHFIKCVVLSSMSDETPEGKSIIELAGINPLNYRMTNPTFIKFTAETRSSGVDFENTKIRKGASDAIRDLCEKSGNLFPAETAEKVKMISSNGGTPLVVSENDKVIGVIGIARHH